MSYKVILKFTLFMAGMLWLCKISYCLKSIVSWVYFKTYITEIIKENKNKYFKKELTYLHYFLFGINKYSYLGWISV